MGRRPPISSYRFADLFEGEGWGWKGNHPDPVGVVGRTFTGTVVSAEVWTWVHSPSFRATRSI